MTDSAYPGLTTAEKIFKELIWDPAIKGGELALETYVPFFALPVIKQIDEITIGTITDWIYSQIVLAVDIVAIKLVNAEHQAAYESASLKLKIIALEKGNTSNEYLQARTDALAALSKFTHFGAK